MANPVVEATGTRRFEGGAAERYTWSRAIQGQLIKRVRSGLETDRCGGACALHPIVFFMKA